MLWVWGTYPGHRLVPSTRREAGLTTGDGLGHLLSDTIPLVLVEDSQTGQVWGQLRPTEGGQVSDSRS